MTDTTSPSAKRFTPEFWPTFVSAIMLITVLGLGIWQMERLAWKQEVLEQIDRNFTDIPGTLPVEMDEPGAWRYRFVRLEGEFLHDKELHLSAKYHRGQLGYHLLTPMKLDDGRVAMVNRGWVSKERIARESRPETLPEGRQAVEGIVRLTNRRNIFIPENDAAANQWFWYELDAMRAQTGLPLLPVVIEQVRGEGELAEGQPVAGKKQVELRNDHLMYAITWFALAAAIVVIYGVYSMKPAE